MILTPVVIADAPAQRQLVYAYTVGVSNTATNTTMSNIDDTIRSSNNDRGSITVGILGVESDGGLVVNVSETGRDNRTLAATTCVAYPDTNVTCGTSQITPEEMSVLRAVNPKFFNPSALDAKSHWRIAPPNSGVTIDYTAAKGSSDGTVAISGVRDIDGPQTTEHTEINYMYDVGKLVPTQVKEYQTVHQNQGGDHATVTIDITASLSSDSGAK